MITTPPQDHSNINRKFINSANDVVMTSAESVNQGNRERRSTDSNIASGVQRNPANPKLIINVFLHDDLKVKEGSGVRARIGVIHADYFAWWSSHLQYQLGIPIEITYHYSLPGITDFDYRGDSTLALQKWSPIVNRYKEQNGLSESRFRKYLLLTKHVWSNGAGAAYRVGDAAVAAQLTYLTPAHEIGHMIGAVHDDWDFFYQNAWWCETIMRPSHNFMLGNCYRYSTKNLNNIRSYLGLRGSGTKPPVLRPDYGIPP